MLESLIPALEAAAKGEALPAHVESITAPDIAQVKLIDATPIGINVRSTVATYANVHDELRKIYARSPLAREKGYKAGDFSYNTGRLRCPGCDGTGTISLDIPVPAGCGRSPARTAAAPATRRMPPALLPHPEGRAPRPRACPA